jgi:hypothetical protein
MVRRTSRFCRHHLGILHGSASARTYACSAACQLVHARCPRCHCLCNGGHVRQLREGLCYLAGAPNCWAQAHAPDGERLELWTITCVMCSRQQDLLRVQIAAPPHFAPQCAQCGSRLLEIERVRVTGNLRLV